MRAQGESCARSAARGAASAAIVLAICLAGCSDAENACGGAGFQKIHDLDGTNGKHPDGALAQGSDGTLFGVARPGGIDTELLFRMNPDGSGFAVIHEFKSADAADRVSPRSVSWFAGQLYGTTCGGGASSRGSVFSVQTDGTGFRLLHEFAGEDGYCPDQLLQAPDGAFYGVTLYGGVHEQPWEGSVGRGVVFKINTDGSGFVMLHDFVGTDGKNPFQGAPVQWRDGALYGTTSSGGVNHKGVIFRINPDGTGFEKLFDFDGTNGDRPAGPLLWGVDGALYGATTHGGASDLGVLYRYCP